MKGYKEIERIGRGGMASVYRAIQESLGRVVAIKKIHPHLIEEKHFVARFTQEARLASSLKHQNIVTVYDFGKEADTYYIVMEYLQGKDLEKFVSTYAPLPVEISLIIIKQLCEGLSYAHHQGVVHRDIKPGNIIITDDGVVKLSDFGIARLKDSHKLTPTGSLIGTVFYIAPEQIKGEKVGPPADVFSTGVVLYELLTKQLPFKGDTAVEVLQKISHGDFPNPKKLNPTIPYEIVGLLTKALAREPKERYQNAEELLEELNSYLYKFDLIEPEREIKKFLTEPSQYSQNLKKRVINKRIARGREFQQRENFHAALREFEEVLSQEPQNEEVLFLLQELEKRGPSQTRETTLLPVQSRMKRFKLISLLSILLILLGSGLLFKLTRNLRTSDFQTPRTSLPEVLPSSLPQTKEIKKTLPKIIDKPTLPIKKPPVQPLPPKAVSYPQEERKEEKSEKVSEEEIQPKKLFGFVTIYSRPWTEVYIDGKYYTKSTLTLNNPLKLPAGKHTLKLVNPLSKQTGEWEIIVKPETHIHYIAKLVNFKEGKWEFEKEVKKRGIKE